MPNENAVHSLEHGGVWLTYLPDVDPTPLAKLADIDPAYVLVSPYPGHPSKVIATAWGLQLRVDSATDPRLKAFVEAYHGGGQGVKRVPPAQGSRLRRPKPCSRRGPRRIRPHRRIPPTSPPADPPGAG